MISPHRRQRQNVGVPRLRRRSLPRLRVGGKQQNQPQHHDCEDQDATVAKDLRHEGSAKTNRVRRRSYSMPKRLLRARQNINIDEMDGIHEKKISLHESPSGEVEVTTTQREPKVSFGDALVDKTFESPFDSNKELDEYDFTQLWYQPPDYTRFQKDRILTSFDYQASVQNKTNFDQDSHSIRGLEMVIHPRYSKRMSFEKKDLWRALQKEEAHQKETGKFPNLERFKVVSQRHTKDSKNRANSLGVEDAKEVQQPGKGNGSSGKSWISRKLAFGAPERGVRRHRSMDSEL
eukprot:CAMPEP_0113605520 /NCGR_PEP_ID=MMETSP0017_2-20120614/2371_1 /TAXON_ID=2856 /ORGANISM="Cylindrotheca closterium" /LENGTH=290 /DNA_ID=CAMNT_0000514015 /DNA_START=86 /DNA_END=958 /DNA_ORIENTATION=+ /assembly_acc=CAM_ASM_000147